MRIVVDKLHGEELQSLRRRTPGDVALEILALLGEKNLLAWWVGSKYARDIGFVSLNSSNSSQELNPMKKLKSQGALISLLKREYISKISPAQAVHQLNEAGALSGAQPYRNSFNRTPEQTRDLPWGYYAAEVFEITVAGKQALVEFDRKLQTIRAQEQVIKERPRFVISHRLDYDGNRMGGVSTAYRISKENNNRIWIDNVEPEDGFPTMNWRDHARCTEDRNNQVAYLNRDNIALIDALPEQYTALREATIRFDQNNEMVLNIRNEALFPVQKVYDSSIRANANVMENLIVAFQKEVSVAKDNVDLSVEDGFVLSIDDHSF